MTAIIGPSGCGKSTLLRCFNRMNDLMGETHVTGEIVLHGKNVYDSDVDPVKLRRAALWDEVKDRLSQNALSLSGGQQQRLCIARTIAVHPEVILMDEPASALDPVATNRIEDLIFQLREQYTVIIVTHNMQQAARVGEKTAFLLNGELIEYDDTETIFHRPHNRRTEEYISGRFG